MSLAPVHYTYNILFQVMITPHNIVYTNIIIIMRSDRIEAALNSSRTIGSSEQNKLCPWIVAAASIRSMHTHVCESFLTTVTMLALGPFVLYASFPLTAGLRGCTYYWQCLAIVTVSLVHISFSHRYFLWPFQRTKHHPRIVATKKKQQKK